MRSETTVAQAEFNQRYKDALSKPKNGPVIYVQYAPRFAVLGSGGALCPPGGDWLALR